MGNRTDNFPAAAWRFMWIGFARRRRILVNFVQYPPLLQRDGDRRGPTHLRRGG
jgi:hypothetical protein